MIHLKRILIVIASAGTLAACRLGTGNSGLKPVLESRLWKSAGELAEILLTVLLMLLIVSIPFFRRSLAFGLKGSSVLLVAFAYCVPNLWCLKMPDAQVGILSLTSLAMGAFAVGVNEEIFLRGFAFSGEGEMTPKFTVGLTAVVFGLLHLLNLTTGAPLAEVLGSIILATEIGVIFGIIRVATGSLFWCALVHGLIDASFQFADAGTAIYQNIAAGTIVALMPVTAPLFLFHPRMKLPKTPDSNPKTAQAPPCLWPERVALTPSTSLFSKISKPHNHEHHHDKRRHEYLLQGLGHGTARGLQPRIPSDGGCMGGPDVLSGFKWFPMHRP